MKQLKKTLLTLVALLAVTTGAWADETLLMTIESKDYASFKSGSMTFDDKVTITFSDEVENDGDTDGWYRSGAGSLLTVAGTNGYTITSCKFYTKNGTANTGYTIVGESPSVYLSQGFVYTDDSKSVNIGGPGVTKIEVYSAPSASSGPEVTWDKDKKSGSFKMPGGNVTLEPEYYPQATVAEGAVTAADADARATTDDPLVKVDATKLTGAKKLMYFVSNSGTTAPAYDAQGWTDVLPTAENYTQAANLNVWYYPVGTDEGIDEATATYSDGDICPTALTVSLGAAPTYAVTFADDLTEPDKWTASPAADVTKGTAVTVTYTGTKKVIGVKAEKKASGTPLGTPLTIEAITPGIIQVSMSSTLSTGMKYSVNGGTKNTITSTTVIEDLKAGDKVQFYGNGTQTQAYGDSPEVKIQGVGDGFQTKVYGNIMSLLDEEGFTTKTDLPNGSYVFYGLFKGNTTLVDASELLLPATTLAPACYQVMFQGCTSLTTAPKLPATTLTTSCYYCMFSGCTSLTNAYVKAAYTGEDNACSDMFIDCSAAGAVLHTAPGSKASWEAEMGTDKTWPNWTVADDWEE